MKEEQKIVAPIKEVVLERRARDWCKLPYPDHPRGCPNYGKRDSCPPASPLFENVVEEPYVLVGVRFDLEGWSGRMKERHPDWSKRQARNCLYWQGKVRKRLREVCEKEKGKVPNPIILYTPEGTGVNVFETCRKAGLKLEKNPQKIVWKIAIIGRGKEQRKTLKDAFS